MRQAVEAFVGGVFRNSALLDALEKNSVSRFPLEGRANGTAWAEMSQYRFSVY